MRWIIFWLLLASTVTAAEPNRYPVKFTEVHDGDTFVVDVQLDFELTLRGQKIRAVDCDTWELTRTRQTVTITDAELVKGKQARDAAAKLFATQPVFLSVGAPLRDVYGRILGQLWIKNPDGTLTKYGDWVRANGFQRN